MAVWQAVLIRVSAAFCVLLMHAHGNLLLYLLFCLLLMATAFSSRPQPQPMVLRIRNLPRNATVENLGELLKNVDGAGELAIKKNRNQKRYATVDFKDAQSAYKAVSLMNGKELNGKKIEVSLLVLLEHIIGNNTSYKEFIDRLRDLLACREDGTPEYVDAVRKLGKELGVQRGGQQPERWIHIKLIAKKGTNQESTTLVIRDDNVYTKGFTGKSGRWFELCEDRESKGEKLPPEYYDATELEGWGIKYDNLMKLNDKDQVKATLKNTMLGKAFAERAVLRLSRYNYNPDDDIPVRLGLAGLIVMICEAARFNPILNHVAGSACWKEGRGLQGTLLMSLDFIWYWKNMSVALHKWKSNPTESFDGRCGVVSAAVALKCVHLVLKTKGAMDVDKAHVEILQLSANFDVGDITVIDEKDTRTTIYDSKKQGELCPVLKSKSCCCSYCHKLLEVIVRNAISGYAWFDIEVKRPAGDNSIKIRCHCRKDDGVEYQLVPREITLLGGRDWIKVSYLVMYNAVKATVAIKLLPGHLRYSHGGRNYKVRGVISAYIGYLEHPIVLFRSKEAIECTSGTLLLARSAVQVPHGKRIRIELDIEVLHVSSNTADKSMLHVSSNTADKSMLHHRWETFDANEASRARIIEMDGDSALEVNVTWKGINRNKGIETKPEVECKDIKNKFTECILDLRDKIANGCQQGLWKDYEGNIPSPYTKDSHPVLTSQPQPWIHVKLQVGKSDVTLAIRRDTCFGVGFLNQRGVWYDLGIRQWAKALPAEYNSVLINWIRGWGRGDSYHYQDILGVEDWDQVVRALDSAELGKKGLGRDFAEEAVRILSRYPDVDADEDKIKYPRLALAGITLMLCESAKLNPLFGYFEATWDNGGSSGTSPFSKQQVMGHIRDWGQISRALLYWRDHDYTWSDGNQWLINLQMETAPWVRNSLRDPRDALDIVHLVFNYRPRQIDVKTYTISNSKAEFTAFIKDLRNKLADHEQREDVYNRPVLGRWHGGHQLARCFHIKLQLQDEKKTSTTLAVRDDTVSIAGFKNQNGIWYELGFISGKLPREYKSVCRYWGTSSGSILGLDGADQQKVAVKELDKAGLGREFATKAVRTLSCYDVQVQDQEGDLILNIRLALLGLFHMVCGSARFDTLHNHIAAGWNTGMPPFSRQLKAFLGYEDIWFYLSSALLRWQKDGSWSPEVDVSELKNMEIESANKALVAVALVYNAKLAADKFIRPPQ